MTAESFVGSCEPRTLACQPGSGLRARQRSSDTLAGLRHQGRPERSNKHFRSTGGRHVCEATATWLKRHLPWTDRRQDCPCAKHLFEGRIGTIVFSKLRTSGSSMAGTTQCALRLSSWCTDLYTTQALKARKARQPNTKMHQPPTRAAWLPEAISSARRTDGVSELTISRPVHQKRHA